MVAVEAALHRNGDFVVPPPAFAPVDAANGPHGSPLPPTSASGLPLLESLPSAPVAVYLDFDGYNGPVFGGGSANYAPYTTDGDSTSFSATEQLEIQEAWRRVSNFLAPFHVNVTTIPPLVPFSWSVITSSLSSEGFSWWRFDGEYPSSFNAQGHALSRTTAIVHEIGHNFGLAHQSEFDLLGNQTAEYRRATDAWHASLMGLDTDGVVAKWSIGHPTTQPAALQDDMAGVAAVIAAFEGPGGDGFRPDDHDDARLNATPLAEDDEAFSANGIIERMADRDFFTFSTDGGRYAIAATRTAMSPVDLKLEVYASDGVLMAATDSAAHDQYLSVSLDQGEYFIAVSSHGEYGDVGPFQIDVSAIPPDWRQYSVGPNRHAGAAVFEPSEIALKASGHGANGTSDAFHFAYQSLRGDGEIVARIADFSTTNDGALAGLMVRESLDADARFALLAASPTGEAWLRWRSATASVANDEPQIAATTLPTYLRLARSGDLMTAYDSTDGTAWTEIASTGVPMQTDVLIGIALASGDNDVVTTLVADNVVLSGDLGEADVVIGGLGPPTQVSVTDSTNSELTLEWTEVAGALGYDVERSADGTLFARIGTVDAAATSFVDASLAGNQRFFYRLRARDALGLSAPSPTTHGLTRPEPVTSLSISSVSATQLVLNWSGVSGETGFRIERSVVGGAFAPVADLAANVPSYTDSSLQPGTTYEYRVVSLDHLGEAAVSTRASGMTRVLAVDDLAVANRDSGQVELAWSAVPGATETQVYRSTDGLAFSEIALLSGDATSYADTSISPLNEYYYKVRPAADATPGDFSDAAIVATPAPSPLPSPWIASDVGDVIAAGTADLTGGILTMISAGERLDGVNDSAFFVYQPALGDFTITARVASFDVSDFDAELGLMVRESLADDARSFALVSTSFFENVARERYRSATGGPSQTGGVESHGLQWFRIERRGDNFQAFVSDDGQNWSTVGDGVEIPMSMATSVGLTVVSHSRFQLNTSQFADVVVDHSSPPGDFDGDNHVTAADIDLLFAELASGGADITFDLTSDGVVDRGDLDRIVEQLVETSIGVGTAIGDANLDGRVDHRDAALLASNFGHVGVAAWESGDFDGSGATDLEDLAAIQARLDVSVAVPSSAADALVDETRAGSTPRRHPHAIAARRSTIAERRDRESPIRRDGIGSDDLSPRLYATARQQRRRSHRISR